MHYRTVLSHDLSCDSWDCTGYWKSSRSHYWDRRKVSPLQAAEKTWNKVTNISAEVFLKHLGESYFTHSASLGVLQRTTSVSPPGLTQEHSTKFSHIITGVCHTCRKLKTWQAEMEYWRLPWPRPRSLHLALLLHRVDMGTVLRLPRSLWVTVLPSRALTAPLSLCHSHIT